jgi:hypothetical protein
VGLKEVRLHDLRHSSASFLVNSGRSLYEVQRPLGHHDSKMTMRYAPFAWSVDRCGECGGSNGDQNKIEYPESTATLSSDVIPRPL